MRIREVSKGFAIVEYKAYHKYFKNTFVFRLIDDIDDAKYQCDSLCRCDGINYAIYDCQKQKLVY